MRLFNLPDLGEGLAEAEIHVWHVKVGDIVAQDQRMVSVETAKAIVEVPAPFAGKIMKLYGNVGDRIATHAPLVEFFENDSQPSDAGTVVGHLEQSDTILQNNKNYQYNHKVIEKPSEDLSAKIKILPAARALAKKLNVDLKKLSGTGRDGQITLQDVENQATIKNIQPLQGVRRQMALTMSQSQQTVMPATIMDDADVTNAAPDLTVLLLQAMAYAAQIEPTLNVLYDNKTMQLTQCREMHVGLAVDTVQGLFVPVLKNIENKNAKQLREAIHALKKSVMDRTLKPTDFQGATMSLSNFGMIGGRYATPIIVSPAVAILACGKIQDRPVVRDQQIVIRRMAPLSLTFDHHVVTGGEAARFLVAVIQFLEKLHEI